MAPTESLETATEAAAKLAAVVTGAATPDRVELTQRDDRLAIFVRCLSGPAISFMLIGAVALLSWGGRVGIWTDQSEIIRAQVVGIVAIVLAAVMGIVVWVAHVGRPSSLSIGAGPASINIEQGDRE